MTDPDGNAAPQAAITISPWVKFPWVRRSGQINAWPDRVEDRFQEVICDQALLASALGADRLTETIRGLWLKLGADEPPIMSVHDTEEDVERPRLPISVTTSGKVVAVVTPAQFEQMEELTIGEVLLNLAAFGVKEPVAFENVECVVITTISQGVVIGITLAVVAAIGLPAILAEYQASRR